MTPQINLIYLLFFYLQALSNLTVDPYRAHCSINRVRVPKFKFNNIYKIVVVRCPQKDNRISEIYEIACSRDGFLTYISRLC